MTRLMVGICCAAGIMLASAPMSAEEPAGELPDRYELSAEERIEEILNQPLQAPLDFQELPLEEIVDLLQEEYDLPIQFDLAALDEVGMSPETEITVNLRNISLRSALKLMLRQPGVEELTFVIEDEVLLITTEDRANAAMVVCMYRVEDLDLFGNASDSRAANTEAFSSLADAIFSCVDSESWCVNGRGEGELALLRPGILVVANTRDVQLKVEEFLDQLRHTKAEIERDSASQSSGRF